MSPPFKFPLPGTAIERASTKSTSSAVLIPALVAIKLGPLVAVTVTTVSSG